MGQVDVREPAKFVVQEEGECNGWVMGVVDEYAPGFEEVQDEGKAEGGGVPAVEDGLVPEVGVDVIVEEEVPGCGGGHGFGGLPI